uniref:Uncharacterized protein n=1 Tax=Arundo donax TaxID=35708 RepID=A0A0A9GIQ0_ARUDO
MRDLLLIDTLSEINGESLILKAMPFANQWGGILFLCFCLVHSCYEMLHRSVYDANLGLRMKENIQ